MRVRRVVLHVGRINRLLGARRHEYLRRQVLIPNRPVVQAFRHICVRNHAPARDGLTKFRVVLLPPAQGDHADGENTRYFRVGKAEEGQAPGHLAKLGAI